MILKLQVPIGESFHEHKATHHIIMPNWNLYSASFYFFFNECMQGVCWKKAGCHLPQKYPTEQLPSLWSKIFGLNARNLKTDTVPLSHSGN